MRRLLWIVVMMFAVLQVRSQQDVAFTNYWALPTYYNPAASGLDGKLLVQGGYSMQMMGFEHAPATMIVTADLPLFFLSPRHGVGVGLLNDKIGLWENKKFYFQYAYHQPMAHKKARLSLGVRTGMVMETFDGGGLDLIESSDPAFSSSLMNGNSFDLDAGLRFDWKQTWNVGMSVMHCMAPRVKLGDEKVNEVRVDRLYYLTGGYNVKFRTPHLKLLTNAIVRTDLVAWRYDATGRLQYTNDKLDMYVGLSYSPTTSVGVLLGGNLHGVKLGYSYEIYTGGVGALSGTHELVIGYELDLNRFKKGKNLHKSVRFL